MENNEAHMNDKIMLDYMHVFPVNPFLCGKNGGPTNNKETSIYRGDFLDLNTLTSHC